MAHAARRREDVPNDALVREGVAELRQNLEKPPLSFF
jgi:hypothetical protein